MPAMSGYDDGKKEEQILIVPQDRIVEKKTHCANCIHWITGKDAFDRWWYDPGVAAQREIDLAAIRGQPLQIGGFHEGFAALELGNKIGSGYTQQQAMDELQQRKLAAAIREGGPLAAIDPVWADNRMAGYRKMHAMMHKNEVGSCTGPGVGIKYDNDGKAVGEVPIGGKPSAVVYAAYHCHHWTGREGWSLAHDPDRKLDPLPAELVEIAEGKAKPV